MNAKTDPGYSLEPSVAKFLADARRAENNAETPFAHTLTVQQLTAENAAPEDDAMGVFPEGHWYLAVLIVALIGVLVDFLFQMTR